ncbi:MAG: hypothetical protein GTO31_12510, partial [Xanthomonadales bacterium]|nr:hypothetical protein [Xanthomonadales bacterium]
HLGLAADAGVAILVSPALAGLFGARYHFAREAAFTADQTYWSVYFGIALVR